MPTRSTVIAELRGLRFAQPNLRLSLSEISDQLRHFLRLLEMRNMPGAIRHRDARVGNAPGELVRISRRNNAVGFTQTINVGAAMRWMCSFKPLSGSGRTNLPVQACDRMKPTCTCRRAPLTHRGNVQLP